MNKTSKAALIGIAAALSAFAFQSTAMAQGMVQELDLNGDGTITKAEAQTALEAMFKRMDTNHDGVLSEDEFVNARLAILQKLDANGDGQITRDELRSAFMAARRARQ
ncbi:MAG TPA: EF-hand domain-containing protein [Rhizomicrobium sp.]|nr:EF-hand domain-containing protein [Rhizomicrobium sp.]